MGVGVTLILPMFLSLLLPLQPPVDSQALPGCPSKCGQMTIPYPFGIRDGCSKDESFLFTCNTTHYRPPRPFWNEHEVLEVSVRKGEIIVTFPISSSCYDKKIDKVDEQYSPMNLKGSPFTFSSRNMFTVTGCATVAHMIDSTSNIFLAACASACSNSSSLLKDTCAGGIGCCQASIPQGLKSFKWDFDTYYTYTGVWGYNPCSFAFLIEQNKFIFNSSILTAASKNSTVTPPVVLDWAIENQMCAEAMKSSDYACRSKNSECIKSTNGLGYLCNCSSGYFGNPYVQDGCKDIDECSDRGNYPCYGTCINKPGSYDCVCPIGMKGEPAKYKCFNDPKSKVGTGIVAGTCGGLGLLLLLGGSSLLYKKSKKRRAQKLRERLFHQNHEMLSDLIKSHEGDVQRTKFFSLKEIEKATNDFDSSRVVGTGGHGTVYKGMLSDQSVVAIKKSNSTVQAEVEQYINEVAILSRIEHRNVVRLLGCCLETEVPLLVYEFISKGTLADHLHIWKRSSSLSWEDRLRIAIEVAGAVSYLHSAASRTVFHRDLKSSNILLDHGLTAKVSDFGTSKSIMIDQTHVITGIQGTYGYLDPEYYHTGQLTDKSDVYSMGVILVELLTGEAPFSQTRSQDERNLTTKFTSALKENQLFHVLDASVIKEIKREDLEVVANLAESCLKLSGVERPTMKEVVGTLEGLKRPTEKQNDETKLTGPESLSRETPAFYGSGSITEQFSLEQNFVTPQHLPR